MQKSFKSDIEFRNPFIVPAIKLGKLNHFEVNDTENRVLGVWH